MNPSDLNGFAPQHSQPLRLGLSRDCNATRQPAASRSSSVETLTISSMTDRPHEPAIPSIMGDQASLPVIRPFPFMKLPAEVRMRVYREFSTLQGVIQSRAEGWAWMTRTVQLHRDCEIHKSGHKTPFDPNVCSLWSVSRTIRSESIPAFFRCNDFQFDNLNLVHLFLSSIGTESRRALTSLSFNYSGSGPGRRIKLLNECIGLRKLTITFNYKIFFSKPYPRAARLDPMRLFGLNDLLKVRDIVELEIIAGETFRQQFPIGIESFEAALQVLKQPRTPAQLKRQEKKDYPPHKAPKATFGKPKLTTRMDKKTQSTPAS